MARRAFSMAVMGTLALLSMAAAPTAVQAQYYYEAGHHADRGDGGYYGGYEGRPDRYRGYDGGYDDRGPRDRRHDRRRRCRNRGEGGTIIGAIAGGLLGNGLAGRGDRTLGTVLGAGGGALAGRAIDRDC